MEIYKQRNYLTLINWSKKRDCAAIGAFRTYEGCGYEKWSQKPYQSDEFGNMAVKMPKVLRSIGTNRCCSNPIPFGQKVRYSKKYLDTITINGIDLHLKAAVYSPYQDTEYQEFVQPNFVSMTQAMVEPTMRIRKYEKSLQKNWKSYLRSIDVCYVQTFFC